MTHIGQKEILTQKQVIRFFHNQLGYDYLGNWKDRDGNSNIEKGYLTDWLKRHEHGDKIIGKVLHELGKATAASGIKTLYDANRGDTRRIEVAVDVLAHAATPS